ncbi:MAG: DivIVA domain-containing protein [Synergistaceae bacterium]|jgi:cell division initiation protein|nr:DivIVA domain-containing protein [Synergistaceae bacterium]
MSELLTSLDIVNQAFKKTMRGYDPSEVDEFLDKVAECIQAYVQKIKDFERTVEEQTDKLRDYEKIKGSLHEALLMAQRTAEEKVTNAVMLADEKISHAERIAEEKLAGAASAAESMLADARYKADRMIRDAEAGVADFGYELNTLQELRKTSFSDLRDFIKEISSVLDRAEATGKLQLPHATLNVLSKLESQGASQSGHAAQPTQVSPPASRAFDHFGNAIQSAEAPPFRDGEGQTTVSGDTPHDAREHLSNTLSVLGIDLSLLNTGRDKV